MIKILKKLHLYGTHKRLCLFMINHIFVGLGRVSCKAKRQLLRAMGFRVGKGTTIVSPITIAGNVDIGENCWINRGFTVHGNGYVKIGDNCDIAPDVTFLTGGHQIGEKSRRAGQGETYTIIVGKGCWLCARTTIVGNTTIGDGSVVAACACVLKDVAANVLAAGVPAKTVKTLKDE